MASQDELKLMAAAIYEIRLLLANYLGDSSDGDTCVRLAAHLSYAIHNEALAILDETGDIDIEAARKRIKHAETIVGDVYADNGGFLRSAQDLDAD